MRRWVETWLARLTERIRESIPETGWCIPEWAICDFQLDGWWARKGDNRWGAGTARGLNRDQFVKIARLTGCKNFVGKRKKFIFNAFVDLKPVKRSENRSDMWGFRSLNNSTSKRVLLHYAFEKHSKRLGIRRNRIWADSEQLLSTNHNNVTMTSLKQTITVEINR